MFPNLHVKRSRSSTYGVREECRLCTLYPVACVPHPVACATPWGQAYLTGLGGQGGEWSASGQVVWGDRAESGQPVVSQWSGGLGGQGGEWSASGQVVWWSGGAEQSGCCLSQITSPCVNWSVTSGSIGAVHRSPRRLMQFTGHLWDVLNGKKWLDWTWIPFFTLCFTPCLMNNLIIWLFNIMIITF